MQTCRGTRNTTVADAETTKFWRDRRVVVTGGVGFVGSFVVEALRERDCPLPLVPRNHEYDLRREADIGRMLRDARPDLIIHLVAGRAASAPTQTTLASSSTTTWSWAPSSWRRRAAQASPSSLLSVPSAHTRSSRRFRFGKT